MKSFSNLIIEKKTIEENLKEIKTKAKHICAVVKADGYGLGLENICKLLKDKVEYFAVSSLQEGLRIRKFDSQTPILIMGKCQDFATAKENNLDVMVDTIEQLKSINCEANIHIKINSGMNRLGINSIAEFEEVIKYFIKNPKIKFVGLFTHFATILTDHIFLKKQINIFNEFIKSIPPIFNPIIHVGGGAIIDFPEFEFNQKEYMFRIGKYFYFYKKNAIKIISKIIKIIDVKKGDRVGYDNSFIAEENMQIAIIPLGYFDGVDRRLSNKGYVYIKNKKCNIISNICMDMFFVDVTNKNIDISDKVLVFYDPKIWAKICNTIPADILTHINRKRLNYIVN